MWANLIIIAFFFVQALDGMLTYAGVTVFGPDIEANLLILWLIAMFGPAAGLLVAKLIPCLLGCFLHLEGYHGIIGVLTALYVIVAIVPWMLVFFWL